MKKLLFFLLLVATPLHAFEYATCSQVESKDPDYVAFECTTEDYVEQYKPMGDYKKAYEVPMPKGSLGGPSPKAAVVVPVAKIVTKMVISLAKEVIKDSAKQALMDYFKTLKGKPIAVSLLQEDLK